MSKPLPKSLHTVTVLVNVATELLMAYGYSTHEIAVERALKVLGYEPEGDGHGLVDKAVAVMDKRLADAGDA